MSACLLCALYRERYGQSPDRCTHGDIDATPELLPHLTAMERGNERIVTSTKEPE